MAQRVVIALAMALGPELLIADEPTTALDVTVQRQVLDVLHELRALEGKSMLLITHDLSIVAHYCDEALVMQSGKVVEAGSVGEVFRRPREPYTRGLLRAAAGPNRHEGSVPVAPGHSDERNPDTTMG
jgi:ABC-type dipeptide/oligopeptide/nickel transport system ATPase component